MTEERSPVDQALDLFVYAPLGLLFSARQVIPELAEKGRQQLNAQVGMARLIGQYAVKQGTTEAEKALVKAREQAVARLGDLILNSEAGGGEPPVGEPEPVVEAHETVPDPVVPAADVPADVALTDEPPADVALPDLEPPDVPPADVAAPADVAPPDLAPSDLAPSDVAPADDEPADDLPAEPAPPIVPRQSPPAATTPAWVSPAVTILAIPDYDSLSASQVLPRLSGLAPSELEGVRAYEAAHRGRRTILTRVTQLQSGQ